MDRNRILDRVSALSACGTLVLDTKEDIIYAGGMVSEKVLCGKELGDGLSLMRLPLPNEVLAMIRYTSNASFTSGKQRSMSAIIPIFNQPHLWAFTFNPSFDGSGKPEAMIVSIYDTSGATNVSQEGGWDPSLQNGSRVPFQPGSLVSINRDDLTVIFMNSTALASLGVKKDDVKGRPIGEVLPHASSGLMDDIHDVASTGQAVIKTESAYVKGMGVRYNRWIITAPPSQSEKKLTIMFSDATDLVSDRFRDMSAGIYREREMLRTIIDTIPVGLIIAEDNGNIWLSNELADRLWSPEEGGLRTIHSLMAFDEEDRKLDLKDWPLYKALRWGTFTTGQVIKVHIPQGKTRTVISSAAPLQSEHGTFFGAISVFHDITQQKDVEEKLAEQSKALKRSNEELQQFAYAASHDLKEPLRMVTNYVFLLQKHLGSKMDDKGREYMSYATEGATRMKDMIDQLLEYSRVERSDEMYGPVDMGVVADNVINDLKVRITESRARITVREMPVIPAIQTQMVQLVENLVSNAIKFRTEEPPRIVVSAKPKGEYWLFSVEDNGIRIDKKYGDRIFTMFQRLHTREEYEGTGMGLALARRIVEHHGGRIWFESEPGKGSTFFFTIPATRRVENKQDGVSPGRLEAMSKC